MKKITAAILAFAILIGAFCISAYAQEEYPYKLEDGRVRDPFVLVYDGKYYMYGTCLSNGAGYGCVVSEDLENWSNPVQVYSPPEGFDGYADYWAPECHYYEGSFYLFATYRSAQSGKRGTAIFKSDSPLGPFELWSDGHVTPTERDCIDGTLYVDKNGQPWMIYVNEWTSNPDGMGEMAVAKLSTDLREFISEPVMIFRSNKHIWTNGGVTDGPFLYQTENGRLVILWSNAARSGGYAVGMAVSDNGEVDGNWIHHPEAFYCKGEEYPLDGGHPMLFTTLDGQLMMAIHSPNEANDTKFETATFLPIEDNGEYLEISGNDSIISKVEALIYKFYYAVMRMYFKISD